MKENQKIPRPPPEGPDGIEKVKMFGNSDMGQSKNKDSAAVIEGDSKAGDKEKTADAENKDEQSKAAEKGAAEGNKVANETKNVANNTGNLMLKGVEQKVMAIGESMKNKTIEKLVGLGMIQKRDYEKLVYEKIKWSLNLSIEDIGNIMKDTEYFQKKQNLTEMEYQPLLQPNSNTSKTINVSALQYGLGYCDCKDLSCLCCVRVFNKRMRLNSTACATIMYSSKSQVRSISLNQ